MGRLSIQAAKAVNFLHSSNPLVLHRDIKSPNFLISKDGTELKLTDFGMSKINTASMVTTNQSIIT